MKLKTLPFKKEKILSALAQVVAGHCDLKSGVTLMVGPINDGHESHRLPWRLNS